MKLAQFRTTESSGQRLGALQRERICDVAALARAVSGSGGEVATWLLGIARFKALSQCWRRSEVPLDRHAQELIEDASDGPAALNEKRRRRDI